MVKHQIPPHSLTYYTILAISVYNGGELGHKLKLLCSLSWRLIGHTDNHLFLTVFYLYCFFSLFVRHSSLMWPITLSTSEQSLALFSILASLSSQFSVTSHLLLWTFLTPLSGSLPLYLPTGPSVFCHGVHKRRRSHVSDSASRQVQRAPCCVSTHIRTHKAAFVG